MRTFEGEGCLCLLVGLRLTDAWPGWQPEDGECASESNHILCSCDFHLAVVTLDLTLDWSLIWGHAVDSRATASWMSWISDLKC